MSGFPQGISRLGNGTPDPLTGSGATIVPQVFSVNQGSDASPVTSPGPTARIARVENLPAASIGGVGTFLTNEANAALVVLSTGSGAGSPGTEMQTNAIFAYANATGVGAWDAVAINAVGRVSGTNQRRATAAYLEGRKDVSGSFVLPVEIRVNNQNPSNDAGDGTYVPTGPSNAIGLWIVSQAAGTANQKVAAAIQIDTVDSSGFGVAIGIIKAIDADFRTDSSSTVPLLINGSHSHLIDASGGTFSGSLFNFGSNRPTGWAAWTGTLSRVTQATGSVSALLVAETLGALINDLITEGIIGA